jgi:hypothetical protein
MEDVVIRLSYILFVDNVIHTLWLRYGAVDAPYTQYISNSEILTLLLGVTLAIYTDARMFTHVVFPTDAEPTWRSGEEGTAKRDCGEKQNKDYGEKENKDYGKEEGVNYDSEKAPKATSPEPIPVRSASLDLLSLNTPHHGFRAPRERENYPSTNTMYDAKSELDTDPITCPGHLYIITVSKRSYYM